MLRRLVVKVVSFLSFSVPLHQMCARAQIILKATVGGRRNIPERRPRGMYVNAGSELGNGYQGPNRPHIVNVRPLVSLGPTAATRTQCNG